jgi:hypothetical protein
MDKNPQWRFREMQPGEVNVDPIEGEFFTTEVIGSITDALVRESIQNSLDAADGNGPVTVSFSFHSGPVRRFDPQEVINRYLDELNPHLKSRHSGLQMLPSAAENLDYILIEDYGTRGLQGDERQYDDLDSDIQKNDFYYFWRNIGRTGKERSDLGRWGLGKTVFQAASRINSFFGLTVRKDDGRSLLMGQSILKIHKTGDIRYAPYGYFGLFDGDLALPIEDPAYLEGFSNHFSINRFDQPGLSLLVPYPDKEINAPDCVESVVRHYYYPILAGNLVVVINYAGKRTVLDAASLEDLLKAPQFSRSQNMLGFIDLARWAIRQPEDAFISLREPPVGRAPRHGDHLFDPADLPVIREKFAGGTRLAFHVPLTIRRQSSKDLLHTGFCVFLERDNQLQRAEDHFIRQGITIPEVTALKQKGVRALVSITDHKLSAFLGDAENPAHTEWERNSKIFKRRYKLGPSTLDFVKTSPREIVKVISRLPKGRGEALLRRLFSLPAHRADQTAPEERDSFGTGRNINYLQLKPINGGFSLTRNPKSKKIPRYVVIRMAYEIRTGNPFKQYAPLDFDVSQRPFKIRVGGALIRQNKHNVIRIEIQKSNFKLEVTGFDRHRDLRIKTYP